MDLEEAMLMEAIWLSIRVCQRNIYICNIFSFQKEKKESSLKINDGCIRALFPYHIKDLFLLG
jgi:hypothetical protein